MTQLILQLNPFHTSFHRSRQAQRHQSFLLFRHSWDPCNLCASKMCSWTHLGVAGSDNADSIVESAHTCNLPINIGPKFHRTTKHSKTYFYATTRHYRGFLQPPPVHQIKAFQLDNPSYSRTHSHCIWQSMSEPSKGQPWYHTIWGIYDEEGLMYSEPIQKMQNMKYNTEFKLRILAACSQMNMNSLDSHISGLNNVIL